MNILEFVDIFPDEISCKLHFKQVRETQGVVCKKCNSHKHYWLKAKYQWQCAQCGFRTTLKSGTILESSNLPFRKWFLAMMFMSFSKKGISACELQRQLNHSRYESIWNMMHKIREAMGKRDDLYQLHGMIEFDEGYFEVAHKKGKKLKRGKGSQKQKNIATMVESTPLENPETGVKTKHCRYYKMKVLDTQKSESINKVIKENLSELAIVFSDKSKSYVDIADFVEGHYSVKSDKETTNDTLKWVHIAISNAKRNFLGVYHKISGKNLQNYINEFCYKLNRRYFGENLFKRLLIAVSYPYWQHCG